MSIESQKQAADEILDKLYPVDPFAIVAGGAPRDWHFGKEAADIDVFFHSSINQTGVIQNILEKVGLVVHRANAGEGLPDIYKKNPHLRCVYDITYKEHRVQLLLMKKHTAYCVVEEFPLSICKAWYKRGKITLHKDFMHSVKHKAIVKTSTLYANEHGYLKKICAKFPEYRYYESWEKLAQKLLDGDSQ